MKCILSLVVTLSLLLCAPVAMAHKVLIGAWLEGDTIVAEVGFGDGALAAGARVKVQDVESGEVLLEGLADEEGVYKVVLPAAIFARGNNLLVVADAGAGHRAEAIIEAAEFPTAPVVTAADSASVSDTQAYPVEAETTVEYAPGLAIGEVELKALMREAVKAEIRPLRREIEAMSDQGPGPTEIIGGIGYLLGLAGLAALLKRPKPLG